jgi:hypothetical protein
VAVFIVECDSAHMEGVEFLSVLKAAHPSIRRVALADTCDYPPPPRFRNRRPRSRVGTPLGQRDVGPGDRFSKILRAFAFAALGLMGPSGLCLRIRFAESAK